MNSEDKKVIGRPFKPGQSGNPSGRPKSRPFKEAIDAAIKKAGGGDDGKDFLEVIARALLEKAASGDVPAIKEFGDRYDGKVAQGVEMSGSIAISHEDALNELDEPGTDDQA
jgi:hypothetical protein